MTISIVPYLRKTTEEVRIGKEGWKSMITTINLARSILLGHMTSRTYHHPHHMIIGNLDPRVVVGAGMLGPSLLFLLGHMTSMLFLVITGILPLLLHRLVTMDTTISMIIVRTDGDRSLDHMTCMGHLQGVSPGGQARGALIYLLFIVDPQVCGTPPAHLYPLMGDHQLDHGTAPDNIHLDFLLILIGALLLPRLLPHHTLTFLQGSWCL